jgi:tetratricopeptide (TPR) repeat protein
MSYAVNQLLDRGVALKRAGDLEGAKKCYIDALDLDPKNHMTYISLGKTAHLLKNQNLAIRSYLAATHIQLSPIEKAINENNLPFHLKIQYDSFPKEVLKDMPKKSAFTIFIDGNTPRHVAHSVIDLTPEILGKNPELKPYAEIYHAHILGNGTHDRVLQNYGISPSTQMEVDENTYIPYGRKFVIEEIQWNKLSNMNVLELYF